ncbi:MAG: 2-oxoacid:ferredoxin oxidoreductase subunit beta [Anaerolineae bacterium]|jgi:2-oxoglutarate ferredoxin oxidoreductase subunit beta|nr:2-oxoacid:ferredoxin oxidoreductase subunit beta [Anaerolineae bacterium]
MTTRAKNTNPLGLSREDYKGRKSTLCPGCGHDSISNQIISMAFEQGLEQHRLLKFSGIGCSSKTPAYFLGRSHGFNALHGRMPSVATGALMANRELMAVAVSGDGDTGSIGMGQFKHVIRRNVPFVYVIENNGVYGLTKGQFSATADEGQYLKYYGKNHFPPIDLALEAIIAGATFVARSFSGNARQVQTLLSAAIRHKGIAVLDIISPCVTFNNDEQSTKSYPYGQKNEMSLHDIQLLAPDYVEGKAEIVLEEDDDDGVIEVDMHDGTTILLKKISKDHDPRSRHEAITILEQAQRDNLFMTGLIYYEEPRVTLAESENLVPQALATLPDEKIRPSREALAGVLAKFR